MNDSEALTIVVNGINQAPVLDTIGNQSVGEGETLNVQISASDGDQDVLSFGATGLPVFCDLTDNMNNSASLTCSPVTGDDGDYQIIVTVADNGVPSLADSETLIIRVRGAFVMPGGITLGGGGSMGIFSIIGLLALLLLRLCAATGCAKRRLKYYR